MDVNIQSIFIFHYTSAFLCPIPKTLRLPKSGMIMVRGSRVASTDSGETGHRLPH